MQFAQFESPVGVVRMLASKHGLSAIYLPSQKESIEARLAPNGVQKGYGNLFLLQAEAYLACYFAGDLQYAPEIELDWAGSEFQKRVWRELLAIPAGETISYSELSRRLGNPRAVRAVGAAVGRNPISILVPCHRVIGSDGSLTGYAGGLEAKRFLLDHELSHLSETPQNEAVLTVV